MFVNLMLLLLLYFCIFFCIVGLKVLFFFLEKSLSYYEIGLCVLCVIVFIVVIVMFVICWYFRKGNVKKND